MLRHLTLCLTFSVAALASDVSGKWKLVLRTPDGQAIEARLVLKAEGQKLTGTLTGPRGEAQIQDGTVNGETISFKIVRNERANEYKGEVTGDTMKLVIQDGEREVMLTGSRE